MELYKQYLRKNSGGGEWWQQWRETWSVNYSICASACRQKSQVCKRGILHNEKMSYLGQTRLDVVSVIDFWRLFMSPNDSCQHAVTVDLTYLLVNLAAIKEVKLHEPAFLTMSPVISTKLCSSLYETKRFFFFCRQRTKTGLLMCEPLFSEKYLWNRDSYLFWQPSSGQLRNFSSCTHHAKS